MITVNMSGATKRETGGMGTKVPVLPRAYHNPHRPPVEVRLATRHGKKPETWHRRIYGESSSYRLVAQINEELVAGGEVDRVLALMLPIDASLGSPQRMPLEEALHAAEVTDAAEQVADETFRDKLRRGIATKADAHEYIRKSVAARRAAEVAEQEARAWIDAQSLA